MNISIIIPTLNEADTIGKLLTYLQDHCQAQHIQEILVVDGGSQDGTQAIAQSAGAILVNSDKGRAVQMNTGAHVARGDILYFLHADSYPPSAFDEYISGAFYEGYQAGCFRHSFDNKHPVLLFTSWLVNHIPRLQFGDQSLFVTHSAFEAMGGFDETLIIMEDSDFTIRLRRRFLFKRMEPVVTTSARKFHENGELRLLLIFMLIYILFELRVSQTTLLNIYRGLIRQNSI